MALKIVPIIAVIENPTRFTYAVRDVRRCGPCGASSYVESSELLHDALDGRSVIMHVVEVLSAMVTRLWT